MHHFLFLEGWAKLFFLKAKGLFQNACAFRQGARNGAAHSGSARDRPENLLG
jgi:hypothetical protein